VSAEPLVQICRERPDQPDVMAALAALDRYLRALYPPEANHILEVRELLAPGVSFFVARSAGDVVATGAYRAMPGEAATSGEAYGEVKRMYVDPHWRRQRVGVAMVATLEARMRAQGLQLALLETGRHQGEAVRLYERQGYTLRGPFGGYPDNGLSRFYEKRLP
jgi:putative acetyltransferase